MRSDTEERKCKEEQVDAPDRTHRRGVAMDTIYVADMRCFSGAATVN